MRVAFFADPMYYRIAAGSTRYAGQLARGIAEIGDVDLRLFSLYPDAVVDVAARNRGYPVARSIRGSVPRPLQYLLWNATGWSGASGPFLDDADIIHTPALLIPPRRRPLVVTVLDLAFALFPQYFGRRLQMTAGRGLRRAARDADAFIAISEHTADDLMRLFGVGSGRVHVIPLAADGRFTPVDHSAGVLRRYGIDPPYILYVGTLEPRKNLGLLLRAFAALPDCETKLVLVGAKGWLYDDIFTTIEELGIASRIVMPGYVPDEDLPALLSATSAFVYPSSYEGFGLPVLEAMQCGAPVITTNVSSLPEVTGDAALLVSPDDVVGMATALRRLLTEPDLRAELRERGIERAAVFSWKRTSESTVEVYREVLR